jgi:phosphoglycerate dehydrogenase-like enzyme
LENKILLTSGDLSKEFKDFIDDSYPEINCLQAKSKEEVGKLLPKAQFVAGFNFLTNHEMKHLKWIHSFSAGVDSYMKLTFPDNCLLSKTTGKMGNRMGEYCMAYILEDLKHMQLMHHNQSLKAWIPLKQERLYHQTIYIIGTGYVGSEIAKMFKPLTQSVKGINTSGDLKQNFDHCMAWNEITKNTLEENCIVINTLPSTSDTRGIVNLDFFKKLINCLFLNVGRGATVNEDDLLKALANGYFGQTMPVISVK